MSRLAHVAFCPKFEHSTRPTLCQACDAWFLSAKNYREAYDALYFDKNSPSQGRIEIKVFIDMPRQRGI
jgi:hypothetical protein